MGRKLRQTTLCEFNFVQCTKSSHPYIDNNEDVDFASKLPRLVLEKIFPHLDVTSIQNCRKVCRNWNQAIIELESSVSVIKDLESDAAFLEMLNEARMLWEFPSKPWYLDFDCSTCRINSRERKWALQLETTLLLVYKFGSEDKSL